MDLTHIIAGPMCTQFLADAGALVIKVEPPGGEYSRIRGPQRKDVNGRSLSSYSAGVNRGKYPIAIDLKNPTGRALFDRLVAIADVVVDNFAPTALARMGISYDEYRARDPRLITVSINLWGIDAGHDLARRGGLAGVAEAESGLLHRHRASDGSPLMLMFALADGAAGLASYSAIVTALLDRDRTGHGRHVSVSMIRSVLPLNSIDLVRAQRQDGPQDGTDGFLFIQSRDGWIAVDTADQIQWERWCDLMGHAELKSDARFASTQERERRRDEIATIIGAWAAAHTTAELLEMAEHVGLALTKVATAGQFLDDPRSRALGGLVDLHDGLGGTIAVPANALGLDYGHRRIPLADDDAENILRTTLGIHPTEVETLRRAGAFGPHIEGS